MQIWNILQEQWFPPRVLEQKTTMMLSDDVSKDQ